jgi:choline dehydrogenase-like flavoprotein
MTIHTAADLTKNVERTCDVCIVGSGAGGAVLAAQLVELGLSVVMLEEGSHHTRFKLEEATAYPTLYQERGTRSTADLAITILQGRSVGGGTTVNWTTCFRTPDRILEHWRKLHGVESLTPEVLAPHFDAVEERLNIGPWPEASINPNNRKLRDGCKALGWEYEPIRRNVKGCANSGYCGFGCPVDGKQAMHVTYLPDALAGGLELFSDTRAERLEVHNGRVVAVHGVVMSPEHDAVPEAGVTITVRPKICVSSAGAVNGPALLLRSGIKDGPVGKRTFLHPVVAMAGEYDEPIDPWYGAPQSIGSHEHIDRGSDKMGLFMEVPPVHPMIAGTSFKLWGMPQQEVMRRIRFTSSFITLCVDGLVDQDDGGTVTLRPDGRVRVDYPIRPVLQEGFRAAHDAMARAHLAAGAKFVSSMHLMPILVKSEADLPRLAAAPYGAHEHTIFSAHQMGGCAMGADPSRSVVDNHLRHHVVENLFVVDGSVFPTALGVNPSESIYGLAHWAAQHVAAAVG